MKILQEMYLSRELGLYYSLFGVVGVRKYAHGDKLIPKPRFPLQFRYPYDWRGV